MTLKTLKDIEVKGFLYNWVNCIDLRAEAIKWIKEDREDICCDIPLTAKELLQKWIDRFNITSEDLKC